jgi:hypothetical protein
MEIKRKILALVVFLGLLCFCVLIFRQGDDLPPKRKIGVVLAADSENKSDLKKFPGSSTGDLGDLVSTPARKFSTEVPLTSEPEIKRFEYRKSVVRSYGLAIKGLHLAQSDESALIELLIERIMVAFDARDVLNDVGSHRPQDFGIAVNTAQSEIDSNIGARFGKIIASKVLILTENSTYSAIIGDALNKQSTELGYPLSGDQALATISLFLDSYGPISRVPGLILNSKAEASDGLIAEDKELLDRASLVLQPTQISVLRSMIMSRNARVRSTQPP